MAELEALVREQPLRERAWYLLMSARYRAGRSAEALQAYREARAALDEVGIEPGEDLRRLQGEVLRGEGRPQRANGHAADRDGEVVKALLAGRVVPVLGLDGGTDLAASLASAFGYPRAGRPTSHASRSTSPP